MKVTFPRMGSATIVFKALLENLGHEVIVPPPPTKRTLSLGTKYAPEFCCFPFKVNMGNYIEALERGADTIFMVGGSGPCRFGYYAEVQRRILEDLGYRFEMVVLEPPQVSWRKLLESIGKLANKRKIREIVKAVKIAWIKAKAIDEIEALVNEVRPYTIDKERATSAHQRALESIDGAKDGEGVKEAKEEAIKTMEKIPKDLSRNPLKVGLVGEIYTVLETFVNFDLEKTLGEMGVQIHRSIFFSDWIRGHILKTPSSKKKKREIMLAARPYLRSFVGGHGLESVGESVLYAQKGYDGVIHLLPFTCMPEIIARSILPKVSKDLGIPIITLSLDEQTGKGGLITRLEAFVDLMDRKRRGNKICLWV